MERGSIKNLKRNFISKNNNAVAVDLSIDAKTIMDKQETDYVFTVQSASKNNEVILNLQNAALEKLATGKPLKEIFDTLTKGAEEIVNFASASILVLDNTGTRLLDGSTPSFSKEVRDAFNGMVIGPLDGSCGTAVYNKELVIVEDISTDPRWEKFKDFALSNGLRACSSSPIIGSQGQVLGSFALTFSQSRQPTEFELEIIKSSARIAALAIEKKQSEENLRLYSQELSKNNRELKDFALVASHDLKEPLRKISLFTDQILERKMDQGKQDDFILRIQKSSTRMYHLIEDLYNWSAVGRHELNFEPEDLNEILQEVIDDLEGPIQETAAKIQICSLPTLEVEKIQMHQLFQNLLSNAMKFCKEGVTPEITISSRCKGDGYCEIVVQDNGIGIDPKYSKKILEPFTRLHNVNEYPGSGIGLAICEKIVLKHSGEIQIDSTPEIGTKITLLIPSMQKK